MLTQCPSCQTIFRVTSEILRVADGQVRCGRCQAQFDALERLIQESDDGEAQSGRFLQPPRAAPDAGPEQEQESQLSEQTEEEWIEIEDLDAHSQETSQQLDEQSAPEGLEQEPHSDADADLAIEAEEDMGEAQIASTGPPAYTPYLRRRHTEPEPAPDLDLQPRRDSRPVARIWKILATPLLLLLLVQLAHNYRATLARHPQLGAPLAATYAALGLTLRPDWNLHAYEILQWHVGSDPIAPGTLKVRATIKNVARFAQPYPLLKLLLEDRWGEQVGGREFEPAEYLRAKVPAVQLLAPAQQANATISIVDPGSDAEGFRFDVCLHAAGGVVCAADVPERRR